MGRSITSTVPQSERKATYTGVGTLTRPVLFGDRLVRYRRAALIFFLLLSFKSNLNFTFSHFSAFELVTQCSKHLEFLLLFLVRAMFMYHYYLSPIGFTYYYRVL